MGVVGGAGRGGRKGGRKGGAGTGGSKGGAVQDVHEVCVDEVGGVDCEDGGEGDGGGVGGGFVGGHCVDFVRDEVEAVFLAEAHVRFESVYWLFQSRCQ